MAPLSPKSLPPGLAPGSLINSLGIGMELVKRGMYSKHHIEAEVNARYSYTCDELSGIELCRRSHRLSTGRSQLLGTHSVPCR